MLGQQQELTTLDLSLASKTCAQTINRPALLREEWARILMLLISDQAQFTEDVLYFMRHGILLLCLL